MATMLQLVQQVTTELGLNVPSTVAGNTNADVVQILGLLNAVGYEVQREHEWQALTQQYITTVAYTSLAGSTVQDSTTLTVSSTSTISNLYGVTGTGINQACYVNSIDTPTTLTLSQPATSTGSATYTFTKVKYAMPSGYDRQIDRTHWDKTKHWEMLGPETAQEWEWLISGYISTGPRIRYRIFGSYFQIWPFVAAAETIGFEYLSNLWVLLTGGSLPTKTSFTVDTDTCIFPDRLMVLGTKCKYFEIKGADTTALYRDYMNHLDIAKANDAGSKTLSFAPRRAGVLIGWDNLPDSGYGS